MTAFWMTAAGMAALVLVLLARALWRARVLVRMAETEAENPDVAVYRDQLREVERDVARGVIPADEGDRLRAEVARRLLEADRRAGRQTRSVLRAPKPALVVVILAVLAIGPGAVWVYWSVGAPGYRDMPLAQRLADAEAQRRDRPRQAFAEEQLEARGYFSAIERSAATSPNAERLGGLANQLRTRIETHPEEAMAFRVLAQVESELGRAREAWQAQARYIELRGEEAVANDYALLAFMMVHAAGDYVSPEAETALDEALRRDRMNGLAHFLSGLMFLQNDRADLTFDIWRRLLDRSLPDDPWTPWIRGQLEDVAMLAGVARFTLPPETAMPGGGPSAEDIAAAAEMDPEARAEMIEGMVAGLAQRLATDGGTAEDWARLIQAYAVMGQREQAAAIWAEAQMAFAAEAEGLAVITAAAREAGLAMAPGAQAPDPPAVGVVPPSGSGQ